MGITDRLFGLGKRTARHAAKDLPDLSRLLHSLDGPDRQALERANRAAAACKRALGGGPVVTEIDALMARIRELSERIARGRAWLGRHNPERLGRAAAEAELDQALGTPAGAREDLREHARIAEEVESKLPVLSYRLAAAARELEALEARLALPLEEDPTAGLRAQQAKLEEALGQWQAAVREVG